MNPSGKQINSVIAIGNPIVDISAEIDNETIEKYALAWGQTVFANEKNVGIFEELEKKPDVTYVPGGSIQNSLRVCSWFLKNDNKKITMLGCTGDDLYRQKIIDALKEAGVTPLLQINKEVNTSRCAVGINQKERCLVPQIKASNLLNKEFVDANMTEILSHDALCMEGYFLVEQFEICKNLVKAFRAANKPIFYTLSAVFLLQVHPDKMIEIANDANFIFCNMEECEALAGKAGADKNETLINAFKKLAPLERYLIVTDGSKGVYISKYNYTEERLEFVLQVLPKRLKKEEIVDTNGAGDSFMGGFISQYLKGKGLYSCAIAGNAASGYILRHIGCTLKKEDTVELAE